MCAQRHAIDQRIDFVRLGPFARDQELSIAVGGHHPGHRPNGGCVIFDRVQSSRLENDISTGIDSQLPPHLRSMAAHSCKYARINSVVHNANPIRRKSLVIDQRNSNLLRYPHKSVAACKEQSIRNHMTP